MAEYEVRTFAYDEDGPGIYPIMVVRFVYEGEVAMKKGGYYGGEYYLYINLTGGIRHATNDMFAFSNQLTASDDDNLLDLLIKIEKGELELSDINDGEVLTPQDIQKLLT